MTSHSRLSGSDASAQHQPTDTTDQSSANGQIHNGPHGMTVVEFDRDDSPSQEPPRPVDTGPSRRQLLIAAALGGGAGAIAGMVLTVLLLVVVELPGVGAA